MTGIDLDRCEALDATDPLAPFRERFALPEGVIYCRDAYDALSGADALVVVTEWNEFRALSPARIKDEMRGDVVVDLRNVFDPVAIAQAGLKYRGIGRRASV